MYTLRNLSGVASHGATSAVAVVSRRATCQAPRYSVLRPHTTNGSTTSPTSPHTTAMVAVGATASGALAGSAMGAAGAALAALLDPTAALKGNATAAARIFPNENADAAPWEASCIELGTEVVEEDDASTSFGVTLPRTTRPAPAASQTVVRLYFETARREGLHSFRTVAQRVALGELPGRTDNRMSVGYAVWIVPRDEYIAMLAQRPQIAASTSASPTSRA